MAATAPYGSWKSPITSDLIVARTVGLGAATPVGRATYWLEGRPTEAGRQVIVRRDAEGRETDVNPPPFNARTRVHEYGGGAYLVDGDVVYFSNFADQRIYRVRAGEHPSPITPESGGALRFADATIDRARGLIICVREDHRAGGEAINTLVAVPVGASDGESAGEVLITGSDFVAGPRLSPDGRRLAWLAWNHPNMPWDGTELWIGELDEHGRVWYRERVAGGPAESIAQPEWSPDGWLHFVSDRSGFWNLYRWLRGKAEPLHPKDAEFARPAWSFGQSTFTFESPNRIVCIYDTAEGSRLARLDTTSGGLEDLDLPYSDYGSVRVVDGRAVFNAASPTEPWQIVSLDLASGRHEVLKRSTYIEVDAGYISRPRAIEFPTEGGQTAYAFYYPPANKDFQAPAGEKPPLIVHSHGGPTGATSTAYKPQIQYWTSRGIAYVDVNYGGSTGYGRAYRQRLNGQWGVVDVDDCCNAARYLAVRGEVDPRRMAISGGSAGGYTTLAALTFRDVFAAGASHFGLSELEVFTKDTHKFESRYLDSMVGPYPEKRDLYFERSPINFVDRLSCPIIFFQGLEDKIVPPSQAEMMVEALRKKGLPVAYLAFEGEQHGFRRAENIKRSMDAELYFYARIFGFELAEPVEPVEIENLVEAGARR